MRPIAPRIVLAPAALLAGALLVLVSPASATVISGSSEAFDAVLDLEVPSLGIDVMEGPVTSVSGAAPPPYDLSDSDTLGFAKNGVHFDASVSATFSSAASSDVDGLPGVRTTDASGGIEDVTISLTIGTTEVLNVQITQLIGSASVTGEFGSLTPSGSTGPIEVVIDTSDWNPWSYQISPTPNQLLLDNGVVQIIANQQLVSCAGPAGGTDTCAIEVNALRILIDGNMNGHYTQGELTIGHAFASMTAIPEPGTALLVGAGLVLLSVRRRR